MGRGGVGWEHGLMHSPSPRSRPQTDRRLFELAAQVARAFVLGMSIAAFIAVPLLLLIALL
jgi:hypothetical protein